MSTWGCDHRNTSYFSFKQQSCPWALPFSGKPWPGQGRMASFPPRCPWTLLDEVQFQPRFWDLQGRRALIVDSLHVVALLAIFNSPVDWHPAPRQMQETGEKPSSKEKPLSPPLEGRLLYGNEGHKPRSLPPFLFSVLSCSSCQCSSQELNETTCEHTKANLESSHILGNIYWAPVRCQPPKTLNRHSLHSHGTSRTAVNGTGPLWGLAESSYPDTSLDPPATRIPQCENWEREVEGLTAASKINKRLIYPTHAANVVLCY